MSHTRIGEGEHVICYQMHQIHFEQVFMLETRKRSPSDRVFPLLFAWCSDTVQHKRKRQHSYLKRLLIKKIFTLHNRWYISFTYISFTFTLDMNSVYTEYLSCQNFNYVDVGSIYDVVTIQINACSSLVIWLKHWLTFWCVTIVTNNGVSPVRRQTITWSSAGMLVIEPLGTHVNEIWIQIQQVSFNKWIWKCHLRNYGHFRATTMCWK